MIAGPHGGGPPPPAAVTTPLGTFRASDYGAKSVQEGSVDASGGINAAIAAASIQGGGKVSLDSGLEYDARRTVVLLANIELEIPTGTTLKAAAGLVGDLVVAQNAAGIRLSGGGTIDANRAGGATGNALTLTGCIEPQVEEVSIQNAYIDNLALVNCVRPVLDVLVGAAGRHGVYHSGTTFGRGQVTARDNGQRVAGHGVVFDAASTDNSYGPLVSTDTRVGGAKSQQYGVFEVPASGCDRNTYAPSALGGNAVGTQSLVGASSGPVVIPPASITTGMIAPGAVGDAQVAAAAGILSTKLGGYPWRNADLATDVARANQVVNGGFEVWQRNGPFNVSGAWTADRWFIGMGGTDTLSVSKNTATLAPGSQASAACTFVLGTGAGATGVSQFLKNADGYQLAGKTISLSVMVNTNVANAVRAAINTDGTGGATTYSAYHPGDGAWHAVTMSVAVPADATVVRVYSATFWASCTAYLDNAMLVPGSVAADYVPLPPADDLARCLRYYQRWAPGSSGYIIGTGGGISATGAWALIPLQARMGGTPTLTFSATSDFQLNNGPAGGGASAATALAPNQTGVGGYGPLFSTVSVASGLTPGDTVWLSSATAAAWAAAEWNP